MAVTITTYPVTTITAASGIGELILTASTMMSNVENCCADVSGAQGTVDLIVDMSTVDCDITVTVKAGDGPTAGKDRTFTAKGLTCNCIPVSTGETVCADGKLYFTLCANGMALANLRPRVAVVKRQNVVTH